MCLDKPKRNCVAVSTCVLLTVCALLSLLAPFSYAAPSTEPEETEQMLDPVTDGADIVLLYCPESEMFLFDKNGDKSVHPYAVAKLVALLAADSLVSDWNDTFTVEKSMLSQFSNSYGLKEGDIVSYFDLAVLTLFRGLDDATTVLARKLAGSDSLFVEKMNETAEKLGAQSTKFLNPTGRGDKGTTNARDCALIAAEFCKRERLTAISGEGMISCASLGNKKIYNRNFYLSSYYNATGKSYIRSNVTGLVAGSVLDPEMLLASAETGGYTYISVVMKAKKAETFSYTYEITNKLLKDHAGTFSYVNVLTENDPVCEIPVRMGDGHDSVILSPDRNFGFYVMKNSDIKSEFSYEYTLSSDYLEAPINMGTAVGQLVLYRNGEEVGRADLVTRANIAKSMSDYYVEEAKKVLTDRFVLRVMVAVAVVAVAYVLIVAIIKGQKKKKRREE